MIRESADAVIARAPEEVFAFIADLPRNYRRWSPEVVRLELQSPGPVRAGTRGRQVRVDRGHRTDTRFRVSAFEPARRMELQGVSDPYRAEYRLEPLDGGRTRLTFTFELSRLQLPLRPFERLIRSAVREGTERVVGNLQGLVEDEIPAREGAGD